MDPYTLYLAALLVALYVPVYRLGVHSGRRGGKTPADDKPRAKTKLRLGARPVKVTVLGNGTLLAYCETDGSYLDYIARDDGTAPLLTHVSYSPRYNSEETWRDLVERKARVFNSHAEIVEAVEAHNEAKRLTSKVDSYPLHV